MLFRDIGNELICYIVWLGGSSSLNGNPMLADPIYNQIEPQALAATTVLPVNRNAASARGSVNCLQQ